MPLTKHAICVYFGSVFDLFFVIFPWLPAPREEASDTGACFCLLSQMSPMANFSNPYIVKYKDMDGWTR
jgi:hypothetical protein